MRKGFGGRWYRAPVRTESVKAFGLDWGWQRTKRPGHTSRATLRLGMADEARWRGTRPNERFALTFAGRLARAVRA